MCKQPAAKSWASHTPQRRSRWRVPTSAEKSPVASRTSAEARPTRRRPPPPTSEQPTHPTAGKLSLRRGELCAQLRSLAAIRVLRTPRRPGAAGPTRMSVTWQCLIQSLLCVLSLLKRGDASRQPSLAKATIGMPSTRLRWSLRRERNQLLASDADSLCRGVSTATGTLVR